MISSPFFSFSRYITSLRQIRLLSHDKTSNSGCCLTLLFTRTTPSGVIAIPLLLNGVGVGLIFQPTLVALQAHVPRDRRAVVISSRNFARCAGGAAGLAVSASVLQAVLRDNLPRELHGLLAEHTYAAPSREKLLTLAEGTRGGVAGGVDEILAMVLDAYMAASRGVFMLQIPFIGVCLLGCVFIKDRGLAHPVEEEDGWTRPQEQQHGDDKEAGSGEPSAQQGEWSRKGSALSSNSNGSHRIDGSVNGHDSPRVVEDAAVVVSCDGGGAIRDTRQ